MDDTPSDTGILELATELTIAWLSNPNTRAPAEEVPAFLQTMHDAVTKLATPQAPTDVAQTAIEFLPAVSVRRSLASKDHIISLIDGKPYKTLKRHLSGHGLTPAEYRGRYGLKADYPMVAENYAEVRRTLAKSIGLGRKPGTKVTAGKAAAKPAEVKSEPKQAAAKAATKTAAAKSATKPEAKATKPKTQRRARVAAPETAPQS